MHKLRRSPFKVDRIEDDPHAFGLRIREITESAEALYNFRSVMISGPRGIGKSSLGSQLQHVLEGDDTILQRCGISTRFPKQLCVFVACDQADTLGQLALDVLYRLEQKCSVLPQIQTTHLKPSLEINLGIVKASLQAESEVKRRSPASIASQFVSGVSQVLRILRDLGQYEGVNIMLDEVDQLSPHINFGHFIKIVHEMLGREDAEQITFIFAGQQGVYSRFIGEDPSFERVVRHVSLSTLDFDESAYVLDYAAGEAKPQFQFGERARHLILALSSGYPYVLHLLGDAAFMAMTNERQLLYSDALRGLETVIKSDKREKYIGRLKDLSIAERELVIALSEYATQKIPAEIPMQWVDEQIGQYSESNELEAVLTSLEQKGHIKLKKDRTLVMFSEELFRVFVGLTRIEQRELRIARAEQKALGEAQTKRNQELLLDIESGRLDLWSDLSPDERKSVMQKVTWMLNQAELTGDWDDDDISEIYRRQRRSSATF